MLSISHSTLLYIPFADLQYEETVTTKMNILAGRYPPRSPRPARLLRSGVYRLHSDLVSSKRRVQNRHRHLS